MILLDTNVVIAFFNGNQEKVNFERSENRRVELMHLLQPLLWRTGLF